MYCLTAAIDPPEYNAFSASSLCASNFLIAKPFLLLSYAFTVSSSHTIARNLSISATSTGVSSDVNLPTKSGVFSHLLTDCHFDNFFTGYWLDINLE